MERPLYISFIWHMHQPYYKDPLTGEISMPWVRLHAVKDYFNMADILANFPQVRQTFNVVPSLLDQLQDYAADKLPDEKFLNLSLRPAKELSPEDKKFILMNFFMANWSTMVFPIPRFYELLLKRGKFVSETLAGRLINNFQAQEYLDIQLLYNLCWFDPTYRSNDPQLKGLLDKGSRFSEEDKALVIKKQIEVIKKVIPAYKRMQEAGQMEVAVSPYYHPIMPLLCDTNSARAGMPAAPMPQKRFSHPEDARWHVQKAVEKYAKLFGKNPAGMWPSEGSVSEEILPILMENGIKWIATDEEILLRSLGGPRMAGLLYRPYLLKREKGAINIIFRDHALSDAVGFIYQNIPAPQAVSEFIDHLHRIREALQRFKSGNFLVSIILDGENAWEYYPNNGKDFLSLLYLRLSEEEPLLKTTTVSDFLKDNPASSEIKQLYPGSWINSNFSIWIGQEEKNLSWDYLYRAREDLVNFQRDRAAPANEEKLEKAWEQIHIAEGSDWNWWYGPQNSSANDAEFDRIYRKHLSNVYTLIGLAPHEYLNMPIITKTARPARSARGLIHPVIDGLDSMYYEWLEAACFDVGTVGGTMHRAQSIIRQICCGFDMKTLFIKVDLKLPESLQASAEKVRLTISKIPSPEARIEMPLLFSAQDKPQASLYKRGPQSDWKLVKPIDEIAYKKILEMAVALKDLGLKQGDPFKLAFFIEEEQVVLERQPETGPIALTCPTADYESYNWTA